MTSIHAPIPPNQEAAVQEAKHRGEDASTSPPEEKETACSRKQQRTKTKRANRNTNPTPTSQQRQPTPNDEAMGDSENDDPVTAGKENNPSLSPTPVHLAPPSPRKNALGKRPLSVLSMPYPEDPDADMMLVDSDTEADMNTAQTSSFAANNSSNQNIGGNTRRPPGPVSPRRKTPKLALSRGAPSPTRMRGDVQIYEDVPDRTVTESSRRISSDGKENRGSGMGALSSKESREIQVGKAGLAGTPLAAGTGPSLLAQTMTSPASRVVKKVAPGARKGPVLKGKPRIGVRRL